MTTVGTTTLAVAAGSAVVALDANNEWANPDFSGLNYFSTAFMRVGSADYRVGSYNAPSGAWLSGQAAKYAIASGADFEVHDKISAVDLDLCINQTISRIRVRQEVGIPSINGKMEYTIDAAASPNTILNVVDFWYYADPANTANRNRQEFAPKPTIALTATGRELRVPYNVAGSQQIVMDCILQMTLGASDNATVNIPQIPDDQWILDGAGAYAYHLLIQRSPGQDTAQYAERRKELAAAFTRQSEKQQPSMDTEIGFSAPF